MWPGVWRWQGYHLSRWGTAGDSQDGWEGLKAAGLLCEMRKALKKERRRGDSTDTVTGLCSRRPSSEAELCRIDPQE